MSMTALAMPQHNAATPVTIDPASIDVRDEGLRRAPISAEQEAGMLDSVRTLGVLQPIIVAPGDSAGRYVLVAGRRRLRAALAAGLPAIRAELRQGLTPADAAAIEAAENIQRAAMAPLDQWRMMVRLQDLGWTGLQAIAEALGITLALAKRLNRLGRMHTRILELIQAHGMPDERSIAVIASAPQDVQGEAATGWSGGWWSVADRCRVARIPRERAIFDTDKATVQWEEDLFAQPGSAETWTTTDVARFLDAQRGALAGLAKKRKAQLAEWDTKRAAIVIPKGWVQVWWKGGKEPLPKGATAFVAMQDSGYHIGSIAEVAAMPADKAPENRHEPEEGEEAEGDGYQAEAIAEGDDGAEDAAPDDDDAAPVKAPPPKPKDRFTEKGRILIGQLKTDALRFALRDRPVPQAAELLRLLLLALTADNVTIRGQVHGAMADIAAAAWAIDPASDPVDARLRRVAAEALARILRCGPTAGEAHSGAAAEWIGERLAAERDLPRLDRDDLLATASIEALQHAAADADLDTKGTAKALRARLAGHAESLRWPEARFYADRPRFEPPESEAATGEEPCGRNAGATECECGWSRQPDDAEGAEACALDEWRAQLARLGMSPEDVVVAEEVSRFGLPMCRFRGAPWSLPAPTVAEGSAPAAAPPAAGPQACAWDGKDICPHDASDDAARRDACRTACPRAKEYDTWWEGPEGKAAEARHRVRLAKAAATPQTATPPIDAFACGWPGDAICREDGTTVCMQLSPRHENYTAWCGTTPGKTARRRHDNTEARANLKSARRGKK